VLLANDLVTVVFVDEPFDVVRYFDHGQPGMLAIGCFAVESTTPVPAMPYGRPG
jgi:hypothetical protein